MTIATPTGLRVLVVDDEPLPSPNSPTSCPATPASPLYGPPRMGKTR